MKICLKSVLYKTIVRDRFEIRPETVYEHFERHFVAGSDIC